MGEPVREINGSSSSSDGRDEGYSSNTWPRMDAAESGGSHARTPQWSIKTESEQYLDSLERKLDRAKGGRAAHSTIGQGSSDRPQELQYSLDSDEDDDQVAGDPYHRGGVTAQPSSETSGDDEPIDDSDTACLLYRESPRVSRGRSIRSPARTPASAPIAAASWTRAGKEDKEQDTPTRRTRGILQNVQDSPSTPASKITFSGTVRICGGIHDSEHSAPRASSSSSRRPSLQHVYSSSPSSSTSHIAPYTTTPLGKPSISRPGSFRSEISRASSPASLYAPLLLPSKTAPSPSRTFYLTFAKGHPQSSYRQMVLRQQQAYEDRKRQKQRGTSMRWCTGLFCIGRRKSAEKKGLLEEDEGEEEPSPSSRKKTKSEMEVLFGPRPWRFLKLSYWLYEGRKLCGSETGLEGDDVEGMV